MRVYQLEGDTYIDCLLCRTPTRILYTTRVKATTGFRRLYVDEPDEIDPKVRVDREGRYFRWIPETKSGLVCEECAASGGVRPAGERERAPAERI